MRINIYAEELTHDTELVTKTVTDDEFGTRTFYGIRFYLASPPELHHSPEDDRSAVTVWVPWTRIAGHNFDGVAQLFRQLQARLNEAVIADNVDPIMPRSTGDLYDIAKEYHHRNHSQAIAIHDCRWQECREAVGDFLRLHSYPTNG